MFHIFRKQFLSFFLDSGVGGGAPAPIMGKPRLELGPARMLGPQ